MIRWITISLIVFLGMTVAGQEENPRNNVKVSGQVLTGDSLRPVPFANITIRSSRSGAVSDLKGGFQFNATSLDTITISSVGFKNTTFIIPDTVGTMYFLKRLILLPDTTLLDEVTIRAWPTLESFQQDFIHKTIPDDYYILAMNNLLSSEIRKYTQNIQMDGEMNYRNTLDQYIEKYYYSGQILPFTIFDPVRWKAFFDALRGIDTSD